MTGLDRNQTPKTRPMPQKRTALVASLDIGTSKIACMIARLKPCPPNEALRGRSHAVELIGYSQIQSRGVKAGAVVDLAECEQAVRQAVALAERMAKVRVESVLLSVSGGRLQGQLIEAAADIKGGAVTAADVTRVTSTGMRHATGEGRTVLHALPVGYALDGVKGIRDPARHGGAPVRRRHERGHGGCDGGQEPDAGGRALPSQRRSHGGESLCRRSFGFDRRRSRYRRRRGRNGRGHHHHRDLLRRAFRACQRICGRRATHHDGSCARPFGACIADAERIKTLYGTVLTGGSDARELMSVPAAGDNERDAPQIVSRATIANIVRHRAEEIFEMVRDRLADSPFAAEPRARVVLSGGASQLTGIPELATQILSRPVRIGRPLGFGRLPNEAKSASFAVPSGLLVYPQYAHLEHVEPRHTRQLRTGTDGYFGKVGRWLREGF